MNEMGRVLAKKSALAQCFKHQRDIPLLKVANAAMHQFGTAARCSFRKIILLHQKNTVSACRRIHGHTKTRRASANHQKIPGFRILDSINRRLGGGPDYPPSHAPNSDPCIRRWILAQPQAAGSANSPFKRAAIRELPPSVPGAQFPDMRVEAAPAPRSRAVWTRLRSCLQRAAGDRI